METNNIHHLINLINNEKITSIISSELNKTKEMNEINKEEKEEIKKEIEKEFGDQLGALNNQHFKREINASFEFLKSYKTKASVEFFLESSFKTNVDNKYKKIEGDLDNFNDNNAGKQKIYNYYSGEITKKVLTMLANKKINIDKNIKKNIPSIISNYITGSETIFHCAKISYVSSLIKEYVDKNNNELTNILQKCNNKSKLLEESIYNVILSAKNNNNDEKYIETNLKHINIEKDEEISNINIEPFINQIKSVSPEMHEISRKIEEFVKKYELTKKMHIQIDKQKKPSIKFSDDESLLNNIGLTGEQKKIIKKNKLLDSSSSNLKYKLKERDSTSVMESLQKINILIKDETNNKIMEEIMDLLHILIKVNNFFSLNGEIKDVDFGHIIIFNYIIDLL